jgi:cytochrome c2
MLRISAAAASLTVLVAADAVGQDAVTGKALYEVCAPCHKLEPTSSELGPTLIGIVGRKAGTRDDFRYSRALLGARIAWDEAALDSFLADPQAFIVGTRMPFSGIADKTERANLISYLRTLR